LNAPERSLSFYNLHTSERLSRVYWSEGKYVPQSLAEINYLLRDYRTMLAAARERIAKLKAAGKTEEEVVAAKPTADYDAKFGVNERAIGNFLRVVYRSLPR